MKTNLLKLLVFVFLLQSCNNSNSEVKLSSEKELIQSRLDDIKINDTKFKEEIANSEKEVKDGDIIVRCSDNRESNYLKEFSEKDKTFSHAGVAFIEDGKAYVYNVIGGKLNPSKIMLKEPYVDFCYTKDLTRTGLGIFRYPSLSNIELANFKNQIVKWFDAKIVFDSAFNIKDDEYMYCSEMIAKGLKIATNGRVNVPFSSKIQPKLKMGNFKGKPIPKFDYYAMDNIYVNDWATEVKRVMLKKQGQNL